MVRNYAKVKKWDDSFYLKVYQLAKSGMALGTIAKAIGVGHATLFDWVKSKPALEQAVEEAGREAGTRSGGYSTFRDFVYGRLPPHMRTYWDELDGIDRNTKATPEEKESARDEMLGVLSRAGAEIRKHLFVHALVARNFNKTEACRCVGVTNREFRNWIQHDPHFRNLVRGIDEAKKDFCEGALMELIRKGDSAAIVFANKTLNSDRGYNPAVKVDVNKTVTHDHQLRADDLPPEVLEALLKATREKREQIGHKSEAEDAEIVE